MVAYANPIQPGSGQLVQRSMVFGPRTTTQSAAADVAALTLTGQTPTASLATVVQEGFRWRNDDGSETSATWLAAQDTNASVALATNVRLRVVLDATGVPAPAAYTLYYKKTSDSTWLPVPVGATTSGGFAKYRTFNGSSDLVTWSLGNLSGASSNPQTYVIVMRLLSGPADAVFMYSPGYTTVDWFYIQGTQLMAFYDGATNAVDGPNWSPSGTPWRLGVVRAFSGSAAKWSVSTYNGTSWPTPTHTTSAHTFGARTYPTSGVLTQGGTPATNADIVLIARFDAALSDAQINAMTSVAAIQATSNITNLWMLGQTTPADLVGTSTLGTLTGTTLSSGDSPFPSGSGGSASGPVYVATSSNITAGGQPTTAQLAAPVGKTMADFSVGRMWDDENGSDLIAIVSAWTPASLAGLQTWFDASDASTFTYSSGTTVSQWNDKSSNAAHVTPVNPAWAPERNGTQNGLPTLVFNTSNDDSLSRSTPFSTATDNFTMFAVYKRTGGSTDEGTFFANGTTANGYAMSARAYNGASPGFLIGGINWHGYNMGGNAAAPWAVQMLRRTAGTWSGAVNGVLAPSITPTPGAPNTPASGSTICNPSHRFSGEVAELIFYNAALSDADRVTVEGYLRAKWGVAFKPTDLAGLQAWYDAADGSTITASAGAVSQWNDKSGNIRNATQGTGANQPTTGTRTINGQNALDFTGDRLVAGSWGSGAQPVTLIIVVQSDTSAATNRQAIGAVAAPAVYASNNFWAYYAGTGVQTTTAVDTSAHVVSALFNGASSQLWLDGTSISTTNPSTISFSNLYIGGDASGNDWDGLIAEVCFYNKVLSTPERQGVEAYLKNKWATP